MRRLLLLLAAGLLVLAACTSSDDSANDTTTTQAGGDTTETTATGDTGTTADTTDLPSFDTVTDIGDALSCDLDYAGIEDEQSTFSTCVFQDEQALIYVYKDPSTVSDVVALGATGLVYGANWTIQVETDATAQAAADATDGAVAPT